MRLIIIHAVVWALVMLATAPKVTARGRVTAHRGITARAGRVSRRKPNNGYTAMTTESIKAFRERYSALKKAGICVACQTSPERDGKTQCSKCATEQTARITRDRKKLKSDDLCGQCLRNKPSPGMKMCASCRIMSAASARKRAEKAKEAK